MCCNPPDVVFRRDPDEMGLSYALPTARPLGVERDSRAADTPAEEASASDGDLIRRIARHDANAFEALYHRYARPVFGLALRRLGDRMRAEDAVQETFAAIWRSARTYRPERGAGAPWLYAVARNANVDRSRNRSQPPGEAPDLPAAEPGPGQRAAGSPPPWVEASPPRFRNPRLGRRLVVLAATIATAAAVGFMVGHATNPNSIETERVVKLAGTSLRPNASATLELGKNDGHGNWPMVL